MSTRSEGSTTMRRCGELGRRLTALGLGAVAAAALGVAPAGAQEAQEAYPTEPPPPLERQVDVQFPSVARDTLDNGLEVVVVENHEQPVVSARLYVPGGEVADPEGKTGLSNLTASLVDAGTESRTAEEIASQIEGVGANLGTGASNDFAFVQATTLTEHLPLVLEIMGDVVKNPTFPQDEFETEKKRTVSGLQVQMSQPGPLASRRFLAEVYGQHPYGDEPTVESVEAVTRDDVASFHADRWAPDGALLVFAGDIAPEEAREAAERWFGDWQGQAPRDVQMPTPPSRDQTRIYLVHRPGSVQSNIWAGHLGIRPGNQDAYALDVMNKILGGGTNARLFLILREEKGWTYGAYSRLTEPRDVGYFAATTEVRTPVTDSALTELMHQVRRMQQEPVSDEELEEAKEYLTGSFPLRIETPQQVASQVADVLLRGLGVEYLESYRSEISEVEVPDVQRVAGEYLRPDEMAIVVVGDATQIHEPLRATGVGPITMFNVEGEQIAMEDLEIRRSEVSLDASRIRTGTFTYGLMFQGNRMGEYTLTLSETGQGRYRGTERMQGPVSQQAQYTFSGSLEPVSASQEVRQGPTTVTSDLSYEDGRVQGTATVPQGPPQQGQPPEMQEMAVDTTVAEGAIDLNMALAAVLAAPLEAGAEFTLPLYSPRTGVTQMTAAVTAEETVEVAAGSFDTYRVDLSTGQASFTLYVTQEAPHMLVKQEFAGQPVSLELQSVGEAEPVEGDAGGS